MTTLALKDGVLAYDSRRTAGDMITCDTVQKLIEYEGIKFIFCGSVCDFEGLRDAYLGKAPGNALDASGFVVDGKTVWQVGYDKHTGFWKSPTLPGVAYAQGSGAHFALGAMDMGATAAEAVKVAKGRDVYTGGKVRTLKVA